jgi:hypothetical protein
VAANRPPAAINQSHTKFRALSRPRVYGTEFVLPACLLGFAGPLGTTPLRISHPSGIFQNTPLPLSSPITVTFRLRFPALSGQDLQSCYLVITGNATGNIPSSPSHPLLVAPHAGFAPITRTRSPCYPACAACPPNSGPLFFWLERCRLALSA